MRRTRGERSIGSPVVAVSMAAVLLAATLTAATLLVAGAGAGPVGVAAGQPTAIDACTTIDDPGSYRLTANITAPDAEGACIEITASDVTLRGGDNTIAGPTPRSTGTGIDGVYVSSGSSAPLTNVTVADLRTVGWSNGTHFENVDDGTMRDLTARNALTNGIRLADASGNQLVDLTLANITEEERDLAGAGHGLYVTDGSTGNALSDLTFRDTKYSLIFDGGSANNEVSGVSATETTYVAYLFAASDNTLSNVTSEDNSRWVVYVERGAEGNVFRNLTTNGTTLSFQPTGVAVRPVPGPGLSSPPAPPAGERAVGPFVEVSATQVDQPGSLSLTLPYDPAALEDGSAASSVSLQRSVNGSWSAVGGSVDATANTVSAGDLSFAPLSSANVSDGVFAPLAPAQGTPTPTATATATPTPTATTTPTVTTAAATTAAPATDADDTTVTTDALGTTDDGGPTTDGGATASGEETATAAETTTEEGTTTTVPPATGGNGTAPTAGTGGAATTSDDGPGFGFAAAIAGLVVAVLVSVRRFD
jgi:PGF-CTERM protein